MTGQPAKRAPFEPMPEGVRFVPYGDADALDAAVDENTAAVILEPIMGRAASSCRPPTTSPAPGDHRRTRCAAHLRRGADRDRPDRHVLRPPGRRCRAGCDDAGQGARRRLPDPEQ